MHASGAAEAAGGAAREEVSGRERRGRVLQGADAGRRPSDSGNSTEADDEAQSGLVGKQEGARRRGKAAQRAENGGAGANSRRSSALSAGGDLDGSARSTVEELRLSIARLSELLKNSDSGDAILEATKKFRGLLLYQKDLAMQDVLDRDVVPQLLELLGDNMHPALQVEGLWALTNIAAGTTEQTHLLIKNNVFSSLVSLLKSKDHAILEQAVWVLGNIAGDCVTARDKVLASGILEPLLTCMNNNRRTSLLRIATWTLSNLCDGQPRPNLRVYQVLETIQWVLHNEDTEVLSHTCWTLSHLCDGPSPHIKAVVEFGVCPRLVQLLEHKSWRVVKPALRTVGNIVCAEDEQDYTQQIIECGAVPSLTSLVQHQNREIQKEACWTLSNIAAGTVEQIQQVLDSGSIPPLVELASNEKTTDPDVRIEACWVLLNATSCGSYSQIEHLVDAGCVEVLCDLLQDDTMVMMALEGLEKILQVGEDVFVFVPTNPHAVLVDTAKVSELLDHRSSAIAKRASRLWKQYFVVCAICDVAYLKNSLDLNYCDECKCNVCRKCDCTVFHLSYQDQLWKNLQAGEAREERLKQQSKKSKRQKKKEKDKKRKEMQKQKAVEKKAAKEDGSQKGDASKNVQPANSNTESATQKSGDKDAPAPQSQDSSMARSEGKNSTESELGDASRADPGEPLDYVDFLSNNGSILDLWKMISENEQRQGSDTLAG